MHTLMVAYRHPDDPAAFRQYYADTHLPLAQKIPGVRASRYTLEVATADGSPAPYFAVFEADFDSAKSMGEALESSAGQAAQADVANFASGGAEIMHFPARHGSPSV
ncbi:EthD family reductase [Gordonia polyisoprenivorans]|uniref:EthD family reductase n=1 Tax=Gordonia polyisoprenivorans TaxID=84595 RepID=UPI001AD7C9D8|nr:EthD family reductase [Gordonia polyisoprenivorans]QTI71229.1 EthD family reductase [Gordonia polyisoprenivorans]